MHETTDILGDPIKPVVQESDLYEFGNPEHMRTTLADKTMSALSTSYPLENQKYRLEIQGPKWDGPDHWSLRDQKRAVMRGETLERKLTGTWALVDKATGAIVDSKKATVAHVPWVTDRGTFIYRGNEYTCLHPSSKIWTELGLLSIGEIVSKRMNVKVWSWDFTANSLVLKPILNWFKLKTKEKVGRVSFSAPGRLATTLAGINPTTLWATASHLAFKTDGTKCPLSDSREVTVVKEKMSNAQMQVLYGSLLGDATVSDDGVYHERRCAAQEEYLRLKFSIFDKFTEAEPHTYLDKKSGKGGYSFHTKASYEFRLAREQCYPGGVKTVTETWLDKLDDAGVAFWFLDDGSVQYQRNSYRVINSPIVNLHTNGFDRHSVDLLRLWLERRYGISTVVYRSKVYEGRSIGWYISFGADSAWKFLSRVAPYVPECLRYKLLPRPSVSSCTQCGKPVDCTKELCNKCIMSRVPETGGIDKTARYRFGKTSIVREMKKSGRVPDDTCKFLRRWEEIQKTAGTMLPSLLHDTEVTYVLDSVPANYAYDESKVYARPAYVYDIEVEQTHNYFANGILVSNCSSQTRLKPGVYTRVKDNGILEAHVNAKGGTGPSFRVYMEPDTGIFRLSVGQSTLKLYPILKAMGVTNEQIKQSWGPELLQKNVEADDPRAVQRAFNKLIGDKEEQEKAE